MDNSQIQSILEMPGKRLPASSRLLLLGGSALTLLGSSRPTIDIDFIGDDVSPSEFDRAILQAAKELKIFIEPVPLERFIPLPAGSDGRKIRIGKFGNMEVYVADPYSIALSKLERGFDTDFDDILFLVQNKHIEIAEQSPVYRECSKVRGNCFRLTPSQYMDSEKDAFRRLSMVFGGEE